MIGSLKWRTDLYGRNGCNLVVKGLQSGVVAKGRGNATTPALAPEAWETPATNIIRGREVQPRRALRWCYMQTVAESNYLFREEREDQAITDCASGPEPAA